MDISNIKKKVESENNNRINITNVKFRNCLCLFNNYSKCYVNIKKKSNRESSKYDKIYGNENIRIREKKRRDCNKETSLEFTYPYRYEHNRSIFLIINSQNINSRNSYLCHNDIIYIIYNNKKYEHVNVQKRKKIMKGKKKKKKKKNALYDLKEDSYSSLTSSIPNQPIDENPIYNSTIFETSNMNFCETYDKKKKKKKKNRENIRQLGKQGKLKNKKNYIYSDDDDSDNNYEHIFTHINSNLHFLSVSNDHIEKEKNLYIQNERYVNYKDVIFRKMKFKKTLFINLDTYNSWILIKKSILINEYLNRFAKNDLVDINDVLYDVVNMHNRVVNCYTKVYINDYFLLINNKTKEILGVQKVPFDRTSTNNAYTGTEINTDKNENSFNISTTNEESNYYKLVLIKKMNLNHLFGSATDINITFTFHNVCLTSHNKINDNNSYLLIYNYNLVKDSHVFLNNTHNLEEETKVSTNHNFQQKQNNHDYIYFNNYITKKIVENYITYSLYIKECLLIIDILYVLNNSYGNLIYIKEYYKYDHETYYTFVYDILKRNKNYTQLKNNSKDDTSSVYSLSSYSEKGDDNDDSDNSSTSGSSDNSTVSSTSSESIFCNGGIKFNANLTTEEKGVLMELNNDFVYLMPKYKLIFHPIILSDKESNSSHLEITREILKLGICLRRIQRFIEINKRGQCCNFTFDIFCCCLYNISLHILNHINKIEENVRNVYNFSRIYMKDGPGGTHGNGNINEHSMNENRTNHLPMCLFDSNALSTCTDPEEKKIFFSINNLFRKNVRDFNLFFNINIDKAEDISLYKIKISILPLIQIAKLLNKIINKIIAKKKMNNSKYLIDLIYKLQEYLNSDNINKTVLIYLLKNITTPLFDFIKNYIFYGKVKDIYREFFIHENKNITPYYKQTNKLYCSNIYKYIYKKYIDLSTNYWGAKYVLLNNKVPLFLKNISYYIFITGKYIDVLLACSKLLTLKNQHSYPLHIGGGEFHRHGEFHMKTELRNSDDGFHNTVTDRGCAASEEDMKSSYTTSTMLKNRHKQSSNRGTYENINDTCNPEEDKIFSNFMNSQKNNKSCFLIYDGDKKTYEYLIQNQHLFASKKMFELYIKKIDIKEKIKHHYFFFFLQISDYLKYFYILAHEYLEKLYNNKKNSNILNKLKNYFDISLRSSVLYHLKYKNDYNVDMSDILSIIDNVNLIIDLKNFYLNSDQVRFGKGNYEDVANHEESRNRKVLLKYQEIEDENGPYFPKRHLNDEGEALRGGAPHLEESGNEDTDLDPETDSQEDGDKQKQEGGISKINGQKKKKKNYAKQGRTTKGMMDEQCLMGEKKKILANLKNNVLSNIHNNMQTNTNVEIYKGLVLSYHNMFPYNLIFNNITIFKYSLIFRILNYCKYIEHKLTEVWLNHMFVKNIFINEECRNNLMICIHTRECMIHFLKCYVYHLQNDVIKAEYNYMNNKLKETLIFDDIIHIHNKYLNNVLKYSFIMNQNIINSILKLISISHIFTRHILKFNFNKNEQIENLAAHESAKCENSNNSGSNSNSNNNCNSNGGHLNRNGTDRKKKKKNSYHRKFIQELLSDQAYISMIHNTIKHYDRHFKNFFLDLTEYVNNNIDDYAHNFLIKLDYNFYYTNKYKINNSTLAITPNEDLGRAANSNENPNEYPNEDPNEDPNEGPNEGPNESYATPSAGREAIPANNISFARDARDGMGTRGRKQGSQVVSLASGSPAHVNRRIYNQEQNRTVENERNMYDQANYETGYGSRYVAGYETNPPQSHHHQRYAHPPRGIPSASTPADSTRNANYMNANENTMNYQNEHSTNYQNEHSTNYQNEHSMNYQNEHSMNYPKYAQTSNIHPSDKNAIHNQTAHIRNNYTTTHLNNNENMLYENRYSPYHLNSQNFPYNVNQYEQEVNSYDNKMANTTSSNANYSKLKKYSMHNNENVTNINVSGIDISGIDVSTVDKNAYKFIPK
ncbi:hypothetical protein, conserved [Plasmodium gonderi]|uniref:Uncharacterized protein n=1 Tax=Plasmodium gonderi TaxID=77519 RepID=A0A1Y1JK05_PLAGO|nr:hypothetical protein, conserved [Plasmodium gonderi]GAW80783.1 hypothetical protein, conserved [Plasmodium gonderi]